LPSPKHLTIITGASRGMGLELATQLMSKDAMVVGISRSADSQLVEIAAQTDTVLSQWNADLSEPAPVAKRLQDWLQDLRIDDFQSATLINNAGVISDLVPLRDANAQDLARALRIGLEAPMVLTAAFLAATGHWHEVPRKVLNISSGLGRRAMGSSSAYCAAKAGMDHFTRCVALEEAAHPHGAKVCALAPGVIDTAMQLQLRTADAAAFADREAFAALKDQGKLSSPAEAAARVLAYLARPDYGLEPVADVRG
jgi:NAD(P)-dependent dehydrogenase (short-subunit alcohol dehydrogenase family)